MIHLQGEGVWMSWDEFSEIQHYIDEASACLRSVNRVLSNVIIRVPSVEAEPLKEIQYMLEGQEDALQKTIPFLKEQVI
jgi:hypothetical protein